MKRIFHLLLILLFALLQCITPLAHAHIDECDRDSRTYLHHVTPQLGDNAHKLSLSAKNHSSQAIWMPQGHPGNDHISIITSPASVQPAHGLRPEHANLTPRRLSYHLSYSPPSFHKPYTQAPPAAV